jgi:hypothetical protein
VKPATALRLLALGLCACGSSSTPAQHVQIAHLGFDVPGDWRNADTTRNGLVSSEWTPPSNDRKESITVIRTERSAAVASEGMATIQRLLVAAQAPGARVSPIKLVTTEQGLLGARVDVDFVPPGLSASYHRSHVVLVDGTSLVHVIYTARTPDADLQTFNLVLGSLHEESRS